MSDETENRLIIAGVRNLKEYGYPTVNAENIFTDMIYRAFFLSMLRGTEAGGNMDIKASIDHLIARCETVKGERDE